MLMLTVHESALGADCHLLVLFDTDTGDKELTAVFADLGPAWIADNWEVFLWITSSTPTALYRELLQSMGRELYSVPIKQPTTESEG